MFLRKKFGLNLYQTKSGVVSFWVVPRKTFGLNLYQDKFGRCICMWVISRKKFPVSTCIKPNLELSHFGWVGGWSREKKLSLNLYQA